MDSKKNRILNLTKKATAVFGAALAALTSSSANATVVNEDVVNNNNIIQFQAKNTRKPMPVLKLNLNNVENSQFVAQHRSHSSHSSHSSHYSHRSSSF
jgi:hypothetical protein